MSTDKEIISKGEWADCYICKNVFLRLRKTKRYCNTCKTAFCEGEHGSFSGGTVGVCVLCNSNSKP